MTTLARSYVGPAVAVDLYSNTSVGEAICRAGDGGCFVALLPVSVKEYVGLAAAGRL